MNSRGGGCRGVWEIAAALQSTKNRHSTPPVAFLLSHPSQSTLFLHPASSTRDPRTLSASDGGDNSSSASAHTSARFLCNPTTITTTTTNFPRSTHPSGVCSRVYTNTHKRFLATKDARGHRHDSRYTSTPRPAYITSRLVTHRV